MITPITLTPIGVVYNSIKHAVDDVWGGVRSRIELDSSRFSPDSLAGISEFSHVEILFILDQVPESEIEFGTRHPRGRMDFPKVGILAQRGRTRPNRIGATVCRLISSVGVSIEIEDLDAIDGTPVLDIKPYIREFGPRHPVVQPEWASELMSNYWRRPSV